MQVMLVQVENALELYEIFIILSAVDCSALTTTKKMRQKKKKRRYKK